MMSQSTSLYRTTKTRNARSQDQLRSSLLVHKQSTLKKTDEVSYHQTYGVPLPKTSIDVLTPIISALVGLGTTVNAETRAVYTVGIWRENTSTIYRCCFIQPEISSMTCSIPAAWRPTAQIALRDVSRTYPDAIPCTLSDRTKLPQLSGRMTPYVVDILPFEVKFGFANISGSYFLFLRTDDTIGQTLLTLSRESILILKPYFPSYSVCVFDVKTNSYKITVTPDDMRNTNEANKNTCMYVYGDGSFRLQGKPSMMKKVCASFKDAVDTISKSNSWSSFTNKLTPADRR